MVGCQKAGTTPPALDNSEQTMIIGKWNLQKQSVVVLVNNVKQTDTSYLASDNNAGYVNFKNDGTYSSVSVSRSDAGSGNLGSGASNITSVDSTSGTYHFVNAVFAMSTPGVAGFGSSFYGTTATETPVLNILSRSATITKLTTTDLALHVELVYTATTSTESKTYQTGSDYYYTK